MAPARRRSVSGFLPFEFSARQSVGLGDLPRLDHEVAALAAVDRAWRWDVVEQLPARLDTRTRSHLAAGCGGQLRSMEKIALARGFMREDPLLLVLDEPTAALDAETEHALFERYAAAGAG